MRHQEKFALGLLTSFPNEYSPNTLTFIPKYGQLTQDDFALNCTECFNFTEKIRPFKDNSTNTITIRDFAGLSTDNIFMSFDNQSSGPEISGVMHVANQTYEFINARMNYDDYWVERDSSQRILNMEVAP